MASASFKSAQLRFTFLVLVLLLCLGNLGANPRKVFFIGLNKTGTKTLGQLMSRMGLFFCHETTWTGASRKHQLSYFLGEARSCQVFCDGEQPAFQWLDRTFPGSAFVLNTRPLESWLVSRQAFYRRMVARRMPTTAAQDVPRMLRSGAPDVHRWIVVREEYHARVLGYFDRSNASADASANTSESAVASAAAKNRTRSLMATTGTIHSVHGGPDRLPSFFMMLDLITDPEAKVKEQLERLLRESGLDEMAGRPKNVTTDLLRGVQYPENTEKAKKCVSGILDTVALTAEERASDLSIGRPVPPLPGGYDGSSCEYSSLAYTPEDYQKKVLSPRLKQKKEARSASRASGKVPTRWQQSQAAQFHPKRESQVHETLG